MIKLQTSDHTFIFRLDDKKGHFIQGKLLIKTWKIKSQNRKKHRYLRFEIEDHNYPREDIVFLTKVIVRDYYKEVVKSLSLKRHEIIDKMITVSTLRSHEN